MQVQGIQKGEHKWQTFYSCQDQITLHTIHYLMQKSAQLTHTGITRKSHTQEQCFGGWNGLTFSDFSS